MDIHPETARAPEVFPSRHTWSSNASGAGCAAPCRATRWSWSEGDHRPLCHRLAACASRGPGTDRTAARQGCGSAEKAGRRRADAPHHVDLSSGGEGVSPCSPGPCRDRRSTKLRYRLQSPSGVVLSVDRFEGELEGLIMVEAEFDTLDLDGPLFPAPAFADREVTDDHLDLDQRRPSRQARAAEDRQIQMIHVGRPSARNSLSAL